MQKASEPIEDFIFLQSLKRLADAHADLHKAQVAGRLVKFRLNQDRKYFPQQKYMQQVGRFNKSITLHDLFEMGYMTSKSINVIDDAQKREELRIWFDDAINAPKPVYYSRLLKKQKNNLLIQKIIIAILFAFNIFTFWFLFVN